MKLVKILHLRIRILMAIDDVEDQEKWLDSKVSKELLCDKVY